MVHAFVVLIYARIKYDCVYVYLDLPQLTLTRCGHCKSLAPHYEKAATALKAAGVNVVIAKVDVTEEKASGEAYGVKGFPTLKWFTNGKVSDYGGGRTEETIVSWVTKKTGPATVAVATEAELDTFKASAKIVVVGVFATEEEGAAYKNVAQANDDIAFAVADASLKETLGAASLPAIVMFRSFDEPQVEFAGDVASEDEVAKFVAGNALPLIVAFSQETAQKIFGGDVDQHLLLFLDNTDETTKEAILTEARPAAQAQKGEFLYVTIDKTDARILEFFGIKEDDIPAARAVKMGEAGMKKYKYSEGDITTAGLEAFYKAFAAGEIAPDLKSEEVPEQDPESGVVTLVGKNFDSVVATEGKAVLVEFYAPWCGHCKSLAPIYEELGLKYKDSDKVIIAKMDAIANEVESVSVSGFPTLKFFPAGSSEAVDYEGGRDLEGFVAFLESKVEGL